MSSITPQDLLSLRGLSRNGDRTARSLLAIHSDLEITNNADPNVVRSFSITNGESTTVLAGQPFVMFSGVGRLGQATSQSLSIVVGIVSASAGATLPTTCIQSGPLIIDSSAWALVTEQGGALTVGSTYYLSSIKGKITNAAPVAQGSSVVSLGVALYADTLLVNVGSPILL